MPSSEPETLVLSAIGCTDDTHPVQEGACRYQVAWSINPHMRVGAVECTRARTQHDRLVSILSKLCRVEVLPFVHGAFDCVFVKDNAILVDDGTPRALLAHPRHGERRSEQVERAIALAHRGFEIHLSPEVPFEGGDVVTLPCGRALLGTGPRTDPSARHELARFLGMEVISLPLRDPHLYHLDTALTVLRDGTAMICREAFDSAALATIDRLIDRGVLRRALRIPYEEALAFAANVVEVGDTIVTGTTRTRAPETARGFESIGKRVIASSLDQFHLAGGSAACLVSRVHRRPERVRTTFAPMGMRGHSFSLYA
jgi:N-dimethylarginine dimethylaminohydrolase